MKKMLKLVTLFAVIGMLVLSMQVFAFAEVEDAEDEGEEIVAVDETVADDEDEGPAEDVNPSTGMTTLAGLGLLGAAGVVSSVVVSRKK